MPASTIHRFLKWDRESNSFNVDEYNKDYSKLIIVDEVSMIDLNLLASLLRGLTDNIKLVLVGDFNQLPSVGAGNVLKDLIESSVVDTIELDTLYRQSEDSYINRLALEIKNNELSNYLETKDDYTFLKCNSYYINDSLKEIVKKIPKKETLIKASEKIYQKMIDNDIDIKELNDYFKSYLSRKDKQNIRKEFIILLEQIYKYIEIWKINQINLNFFEKEKSKKNEEDIILVEENDYKKILDILVDTTKFKEELLNNLNNKATIK